ncbi:hypothetical protein I553_3999 [Mycobacterium xenopi 4042]|uniref:Uncharacterized protein n=1 Tax=Mycobacterium xenopi 4042 TaxID=1299334 RepID=X8AI34_MYCXE|nr:hypothetical protein I553_3999 [Mycobacterium xenopi 4042]
MQLPQRLARSTGTSLILFNGCGPAGYRPSDSGARRTALGQDLPHPLNVFNAEVDGKPAWLFCSPTARPRLAEESQRGGRARIQRSGRRSPSPTRERSAGTRQPSTSSVDGDRFSHDCRSRKRCC